MMDKNKCFVFSLLEAENRIREIAMSNMLSPAYCGGKRDKYAEAVPYYNDGVITMAEALINVLKKEEDADAAT